MAKAEGGLGPVSLFQFLECNQEGQLRRLSTGQYLFSQGDPAQAVFAVKSGRIILTRHLHNGVVVPMHTALAGETIAEPALFSDHYHCDAIACEASEVIAYSKPALLEAIHRLPGLAFTLLKDFAHQIQKLRGRIELRNIRSASERVMKFLQANATDAGLVVFDRPLKDIALELGLTHEVFYRTLSALAQGGSISRLGERTFKVEG